MPGSGFSVSGAHHQLDETALSLGQGDDNGTGRALGDRVATADRCGVQHVEGQFRIGGGYDREGSACPTVREGEGEIHGRCSRAVRPEKVREGGV